LGFSWFQFQHGTIKRRYLRDLAGGEDISIPTWYD